MVNRQRKVPLPFRKIRARLPDLCQGAMEFPGKGNSILPELSAVDVVLVGPRVIAKLHGQFMNDPTPTDVITFQHGEVVICPWIAAAQAAGQGHSVFREVLTYIAHGFLHLNGWEDADPVAAAEMAAVQEILVARVYSGE